MTSLQTASRPPVDIALRPKERRWAHALPLLVLAAVPLAGTLDGWVGAGLAVAGALWLVGQFGSNALGPTRITAIVYLGSAVVAVAGLRIGSTALDVTEVVVTMLLIAPAVRGVSRLDTHRAVGPGVVASLAAGASAVAAVAGEHSGVVLGAAVASVAALILLLGLVGIGDACLGPGGSLLCGFVLALVAAQTPFVERDVAMLLVALLVLGLPMLDSILVFAGQARGFRQPPEALGLVGRLEARRLSSATAAVLVIGAAVAFAALAAAAAAGVLRVWVPLGVGVVMVLLLVAVVGAPPAGGRRRRADRRRLFFAFAVVVGGLVLVVPAAVAVARARETATQAAAAAERAVDAVRLGDAATAEAQFETAVDGFEHTNALLGGPFGDLGRAVPGLATNVAAIRELSEVGEELSRTGERLAVAGDPQELRIVDGTVPVDQLAELEPELDLAAEQLAAGVDELTEISGDFLLSQVTSSIDEVEQRIDKVARETRLVADAADLLPAILGSEGPRRYFLAVQNNAETRGTGGFVGNWGDIDATDGELDLVEFDRISVLNDRGAPDFMLHAPSDYFDRYALYQFPTNWQNLNMTPDFPTYAEIVADLYPQSGGGQIDGVIALDPIGLASVLYLTGPVTVPEWPEPISAENVVRVTLSEAYIEFTDNDSRAEFLGTVADAAWTALTTQDLGEPKLILDTLTAAVRTKHLMLWFARPEEQAFAERVGLTGAVPEPGGDLSLVTTQNSGSNKIDPFLTRDIRYEATLTPRPGEEAFDVSARLEVRLDNAAPTTGLPPYIIGPNYPGLVAGTNYCFFSAYTPLSLESATLDGQPVLLDAGEELDYQVFSIAPVEIGAGDERILVLELTGTIPWSDAGWYELDLVRQPLLAPDDVRVDLNLPPGFRFVDASGVQVGDGGRSATTSVLLNEDDRVRVRVERADGSNL